jgi:hypothetical protein
MSGLTWQEGVALDVLGVLLGRGPLPSFEGYTAPTQLRPAFTQVVADRIVRRCLEELVRRGGWRPRTVLRGGQRTTGSVFEGALQQDFDFRFTECTQRFAEQATRQLPLLSESTAGRKAGTGKRQLRDMLIVTGTAPGDWLFLALVEENLPKLALPQEALAALIPRLRQGSPLAYLLALGGSGQLVDNTERLRRLLAPNAVRLVECLDDLFVQRWRRVLMLEPGLRSDPDASAHLEAFVRRWLNLTQVQREWLALLDTHRRLDLARPLMLVLVEWGAVLSERKELRQSVRQWSNARSVRELDQAASAVAASVSLVDVLEAHGDEMRAQRYGDERYEEAQLYLRDLEEIMGSRREELRGMDRQLRGVIG